MNSSKIKIPDGVKVDLIDSKAHFTFTSGFKLVLSWQYLFLEVKEGDLFIHYAKKWANKARSIVNTWTNLIEKYSKNPVFKYTVQACYKHFPIIMNLQNNVITVNNFLGLKKQFKIGLSDVISSKIQNKKVMIETYNDILTGSDLNKLNALRYKTHLRKLDRRIFTDGFIILKE